MRLFLLLCFLLGAQVSVCAQDYVIWHGREAGNEKGAGSWLRAFPIGNGSLGGMVYGNVGDDLVWLNHDTLYALEPETAGYIPDIRKIRKQIEKNIAEGNYSANDKLVGMHCNGRSNGPYVSIGALTMDPDHGSSDPKTAADYRKALDLQTGIVTLSYTLGGVTYTREYFASHPDQAIVVRFTASQPGKIGGSFGLTTLHLPTTTWHLEGDELLMAGQGPGEAYRRKLTGGGPRGAIGMEYKYPAFFRKEGDAYVRKDPRSGNVLYGETVDGRGTFFSARIKALAEGGRLSADEHQLVVKQADSLTLVLVADTSFNGTYKSPSREGRDCKASSARLLAAAAARSYESLRQRHVEDYRALYGRLSIRLGEADPARSSIPTDERVAAYQDGNDPALVSLFYQFSRYLMMAGSRPGTQPLNLQGIWSQGIIPPWNGAYTTNINAEMNYWNVERGNLSECHEPFLRAILEAHPNGEKVARGMFGYSGWCMHHNISIWRSCAPVDGDSKSAFWPMGAGWFLQHVWEHFQFTNDTDFLERYYPALLGAAEFYTQWLTEDEQGRLLTPFGVSPEHQFVYRDKFKSSISPGCTMDMSIIRETFAHLLAATELLGKEEDGVVATVRKQLPRLLPLQIGGEGQLQEWYKDFRDGKKSHRHISHLYGFFPGQEITRGRPELVQAVRRSMERRGNGATGWSMGWKLCVWARLCDPGNFNELLGNLMTPKRIAPNLFDLHPPFQIDGNFGAARGIAECLVQDHEGRVVLLPCLLEAWRPEGAVRGMVVKGNHELDFSWKDGVLTSLVVRSCSGRELTLSCGDRSVRCAPPVGSPFDALALMKRD